MAPATLAVAPAGRAVYPVRYGYCARYPGGYTVTGEYDDRWEFLDMIDALLRNGFEWTIVLPEGHDWWAGALGYTAHRAGAHLTDVCPPDVPDAALRKSGLWRRGMTAANQAARLILAVRVAPDPCPTTSR